MKAKSEKSPAITSVNSDEFDRMASDIAMEVWNQLTHLPKLNRLQPRDFPGLYEVICRSLKHYRHPS